MDKGLRPDKAFCLCSVRQVDSLRPMAQAKILRIYLDEPMRSNASAGRHNFMARITTAFTGVGYRVEYCSNSEIEYLKSANRRGYALFAMQDPFHASALSFRRSYFFPFWSIEPTAKRWQFHVARSEFRSGDIDPDQALPFVNQWRRRLFSDFATPSSEGFIYIPLQGKLTLKRSFQFCSPLAMIEAVLEHDTSRKIITTLHPGETYTTDELAALDRLVTSHPRLSLQTGGVNRFLPACDYVVTQNSAVALTGYFFAKTAILFGRVDFHHIAVNVHDHGPAQSFSRAQANRPDFDRYLYWFLQLMSINAGRPEAEDNILTAVRRGGWTL